MSVSFVRPPTHSYVCQNSSILSAVSEMKDVQGTHATGKTGKTGKMATTKSLSGKTQGIWKFWQNAGKTQGILLAQVLDCLILNISEIAHFEK